jgi:GT2 family glycosyltransferase
LLTEKIGIIIVTFNAWDEVNACLGSLQTASLGQAVTYVIDNGSKDERCGRLNLLHKWVKYVVAGSNLGYCGGNNVGINLALAEGCEAVLILNPDVRVAPNFLELLEVAMFANPGCDAVGPIWRTLDGEQRIARNIAKWDAKRAEYIWKCPPAATTSNVVKTDAISGCCMLLSRRIIERVGAFDERFFMYWEEIDLCRRIDVAGGRQFVEPRAVIWHRTAEQTSGRTTAWKSYYFYRNWLLFLDKHGFLKANNWARIVTHLFKSGCSLGMKDPLAGIKIVRNGLLGIRDFMNGRFGLREFPS